MKKYLIALCLLLSLLIISGCGNDDKPGVGNIDKPEVDNISMPGEFIATLFYFEGNEYAVYDNGIFVEEKARYGLRDRGETITEADLGEQMGTVMGCGNAELNGCAVYHYAKFPDIDTICIVDTPDGYRFFKCEWLSLPEEVLQNSSAVLDAYGLPDSIVTLDVLTRYEERLHTIEDEDTIRAIFEIFSGKTNIGLTECNRLISQAWQDTYGTDEVIFDGVGIGYKGEDVHDINRRFEAFMAEGSRTIQFTTDNGFQRYINFTLVTRVVSIDNGFYALTEDEAVRLSALLEPIS